MASPAPLAGGWRGFAPLQTSPQDSFAKMKGRVVLVFPAARAECRGLPGGPCRCVTGALPGRCYCITEALSLM